MKLEHGKKYVTASGEIVGQVCKYPDGRFVWKDYLWVGDGTCLVKSGKVAGGFRRIEINIDHNIVGECKL